MTQLYQTQNQKPMLNRELEFELQSQGTHQDCFSINEKKNPPRVVHKKHLENM